MICSLALISILGMENMVTENIDKEAKHQSDW